MIFTTFAHTKVIKLHLNGTIKKHNTKKTKISKIIETSVLL